jgi:hypothetical protein
MSIGQEREGQMKIHTVSGFGVQFLHRAAWKANLIVNGKVVDIVPVVTIRNEEWKIARVTRILGVRFKNRAEAIKASKTKEPFYVAVAWNAAPAGSEPAIADGFFAVFVVQSTGDLDEEFKEINARILGGPISAAEFVALKAAA